MVVREDLQPRSQRSRHRFVEAVRVARVLVQAGVAQIVGDGGICNERSARELRKEMREEMRENMRERVRKSERKVRERKVTCVGAFRDVDRHSPERWARA